MTTTDKNNTCAPETEAPVAMKTFRTPGGVDVWRVESDLVPLIALSFTFEGGAAQDPDGKSGTAQMMSRLLDEGAGPYSSDQFQEQLASRAIEMSFSAGPDGLSGSLKTLEKYADEAFELLRLAIAEARFDADAVERVRSQMVAGLRYQQNDPGFVAARRFIAEAFPGHPYGRPVSGTIESVSAVTRDDLLGLYRKIFGRGRVKLAVVGAMDEQRLAGLIDKVFASLPEAKPLTVVPPVTIANLGKQFVVDVDVPQSVIRFGMQGIPILDPDFVPAYVLNHIFGGGTFTSRLFIEVRDKRGLAYNVGTALSSYRTSAITIGYTATKNERVEECLKVIAEETERMKQDGPTDEELAKAKDYLTGSYLLSFDTSTKIASQLNQIAFEGLGADYIAKRNSRVAAVTKEDLRRVARRIFGDGKFLTVVVGRPEGLVGKK